MKKIILFLVSTLLTGAGALVLSFIAGLIFLGAATGSGCPQEGHCAGVQAWGYTAAAFSLILVYLLAAVINSLFLRVLKFENRNSILKRSSIAISVLGLVLVVLTLAPDSYKYESFLTDMLLGQAFLFYLPIVAAAYISVKITPRTSK